MKKSIILSLLVTISGLQATVFVTNSMSTNNTEHYQTGIEEESIYIETLKRSSESYGHGKVESVLWLKGDEEWEYISKSIDKLLSDLPGEYLDDIRSILGGIPPKLIIEGAKNLAMQTIDAIHKDKNTPIVYVGNSRGGTVSRLATRFLANDFTRENPFMKKKFLMLETAGLLQDLFQLRSLKDPFKLKTLLSGLGWDLNLDFIYSAIKLSSVHDLLSPLINTITSSEGTKDVFQELIDPRITDVINTLKMAVNTDHFKNLKNHLLVAQEEVTAYKNKKVPFESMKNKIKLLVTQASPKELSIFDVNSTIVEQFDAYYSPVDKHIQILSLGCLAEDNDHGNEKITNIRTKILDQYPEHTSISGSEILAKWMFAIPELKYENINNYKNTNNFKYFEVGKDCEIDFSKDLDTEPTYKRIELRLLERRLNGKLGWIYRIQNPFSSCMR